MLEVTLNGSEERDITRTPRKGGISTSCQGTHIPELKKKRGGGEVSEVEHMAGMDKKSFSSFARGLVNP